MSQDPTVAQNGTTPRPTDVRLKPPTAQLQGRPAPFDPTQIAGAAAYAILQGIRRAARGTSLKKSQITNLRLSVIKVAARVVATTRRIVVHLPETFAYLTEWRIIARRLGAIWG